MTSLVYQEQQIEELEYNLFTTTKLEQELKIVADKDINWCDCQINLAIIGASHRVKVVQPKGEDLIEVLACVSREQVAVKPEVNKNISAGGKLTVDYSLTEDLAYQFEVEILSFATDQQYQQFSKSLAKEEENYLYYIFPGPTETAITAIKYQQAKHKFNWITYHSYATEKKVVKTTSVIEDLTNNKEG